MTERHQVYVDGKVRLCRRLCSTCIFRPGNLMQLNEGTVELLVAEATENNSTIVCHQTLDQPLQAACRGFFDRYATPALQIAERLGVIEEVDPAG